MINRQVFFMHMPKTGGMTVEAYLESILGESAPVYYDNELFSVGENVLKTAALVNGHFPYYVSQVLSEDAFCFTWFREPISRTLSAIKHILRDRDHILHEDLIRNSKTISDAFKISEIKTTLSNPLTRFMGADINFSELHYQVIKGDVSASDAAKISANARRCEPDDVVLARALKRLDKMDYVGFTESMSEDLEELAGLIGGKIPDGKARVNSSLQHQALEFEGLSDEGRRLVLEATSYDRVLYERAFRKFKGPRLSPKSAQQPMQLNSENEFLLFYESLKGNYLELRLRSSDLELALEESKKYVESLVSTLEKKEQYHADLLLKVDGGNGNLEYISPLKSVVLEKDELYNSLNSAYKSKCEEVESLIESAEDRILISDTYVASLLQAIEGKDEYIKSLLKTLEMKEKDISNLILGMEKNKSN